VAPESGLITNGSGGTLNFSGKHAHRDLRFQRDGRGSLVDQRRTVAFNNVAADTVF